MIWIVVDIKLQGELMSWVVAISLPILQDLYGEKLPRESGSESCCYHSFVSISCNLNTASTTLLHHVVGGGNINPSLVPS